MTVQELVEELYGLPPDTIVCLHAQFGGDKYELNLVSYEEGVEYFDIEDEPKTGNIVVL